jgi:acetate---CoA ligase (ADP-forming)
MPPPARSPSDAAGPLDVLRPSSVLLLGPARPGSRTSRAFLALRRHAAPGAVARVDASRGADAVRIGLAAAAAPGRGFGCAVCHDVEVAVLLAVLDDLTALGVRLLVLGSGPAPGLDGLVTAARRAGIRVLGPGAYGPFVAEHGLFLNPLPGLRPSSLAVLTQSGNVLLSAVADQRHLAGSVAAVAWGLGRASDLGPAEAVTLLADDPAVTAIAVHGEGFGEGRAVLRAVARAARRKPVVLLHGGTSDAGRTAATSHTGSLGTPRAVVHGAFTQAGAEVLDRTDELVPVGLALSVLPPSGVAGLVVVADGGGQGTLMVDALAGQGIGLAELRPATARRLAALLGPDAHVGNPVDVGMGPIEQPVLALDAVGRLLLDEAVDCVVAVGVIGGYAQHFDDAALVASEVAAATELGRLSQRLRKPVVLVSGYAPDLPEAYRVLWDHGVPVLLSVDLAARALRALRSRTWFLATQGERTGFEQPDPRPVAPRSATEQVTTLDEQAGREWLLRRGLDTGPYQVVRTAQEAVSWMEPGARYALKVLSSQVVHKSDVGGVRLDVTGENAAGELAALLAAVTVGAPDAVVEGVAVVPMAPAGVELILGGYRDPELGPMVMVGSGGLLAELVRDAGFRAAPPTVLEADELLRATRRDRLLAGWRGRPEGDREAVLKLLVRLGEVMAAHPEVSEIDLNPVVVAGDSLHLVDVRVVLTGKPPTP